MMLIEKSYTYLDAFIIEVYEDGTVDIVDIDGDLVDGGFTSEQQAEEYLDLMVQS